MNTADLARDMLRRAHEMLEATMADVTPEQAHWAPPGKAHPIGALYAHTVMGEDGIVNRMARPGTPLCRGEWADKLGLSAVPPQGQPWEEWARGVRVDLPALREYAQAVYAVTDEYLAGLTEEKVDQGGDNVLRLFAMLVGHVNMHAGEISCLKGLQWAKGYPM